MLRARSESAISLCRYLAIEPVSARDTDTSTETSLVVVIEWDMSRRIIIDFLDSYVKHRLWLTDDDVTVSKAIPQMLEIYIETFHDSF